MDPRTDAGCPVMTVWWRRPMDRVMVHSDQDSQYGSDDWLRFLKAGHPEPGSGHHSNCRDNAVPESVFGGLKKERIKKADLQHP